MAGIAPKRRVAPAARGQRFAVVVARFNEAISKKLLDGALAALAEHGGQRRRGGGALGAGLLRAAAGRAGPRADPPLRRHRVRGRGDPGRDPALRLRVRRGRARHQPRRARHRGAGDLRRDHRAHRGAGVGAGGRRVGNRGEEAALAALEMAGWLRSLRAARRAGADGPPPQGAGARAPAPLPARRPGRGAARAALRRVLGAASGGRRGAGVRGGPRARDQEPRGRRSTS